MIHNTKIVVFFCKLVSVEMLKIKTKIGIIHTKLIIYYMDETTSKDKKQIKQNKILSNGNLRCIHVQTIFWSK